jgi:hypothetical protein
MPPSVTRRAKADVNELNVALSKASCISHRHQPRFFAAGVCYQPLGSTLQDHVPCHFPLHWRHLLGAFLSPTAILHFWTGVSLLFGLVWAKTVEAAA